MGILLGLLTALAYGGGDYVAGLAARHAPALSVVLYSKLLGAAMLATLAWVTGAPPAAGSVGWSIVAGLSLGLGSFLYFRALAGGDMGVVATVVATWTAVVPFGIGLALLGERPSMATQLGAFIVIVSIALVTGGVKRKPVTVTGHVMGTVARATPGGLVLGGFFVFLDLADASRTPLWSATWVLLAAAATVALVLPFTAGRRPRGGRTWALVAATGVCQAVATSAFAVALGHGLLSVVAVAAALSPAPTAMLAWWLSGERLARLQVLGLALALAGIATMSLG